LSIRQSVFASALKGTALGLLVLGVGGRVIMRVIAHWEGRVPVLTFGGTITVLFAATAAGLAAGVVQGLLRSAIRNAPARSLVFLLFCVGFTWYGVIGILPRPRLLFVGLTVVYVILMEAGSLRPGRSRSKN
jgi:hypothetical protein